MSLSYSDFLYGRRPLNRWGRFNMMVLTNFACAAFTFSMWFSAAAISSTNVVMLTVYMTVFGLSSGTGVSLMPVCVAQICETKDYGKRYGTAYAFASIATLTGTPIAGQILNSQNGSYTGLVAFCGSCYLGSMIFFSLARGTGKGWKLMEIY
ncbi:hypothetical protein V1520DRAFT_351233 [Lipomyces starkeyi]